jgi:circadian clock protein KaiC
MSKKNPGESGQRQEHQDDSQLPGAQPLLSAGALGVPRLGLLLGGGIPRGSLVIIVGPPGSGKTTLANQLACAVAKAGRRAITFTALSEPTNKLVAHLRTFSFFDEALLGGPWQVVSLQQSLEAGLAATATELISVARRSRADLVVLDGFRGIRGVAQDPQEARGFLYNVGTQLGVLGVTTLITSEADPRDPVFFPEATTADVIIGLHYAVEGVRQRRAIEVIKVRGAKPLPGLHGVRLTHGGVAIFPRLESLVANLYESENDSPDEPQVRDETPTAHLSQTSPDVAVLTPEAEASSSLVGRASFGLPELDALLGGGLTRDSSTIVLGSPGTGKTLLALSYALSGVAAGEPVVYVTLREDRAQLLRKADQFALGPALRAALAPGGGLALQQWAPVELEPDVVALRLLAEIDRSGARRVIIDSIGEIERAVARSGDPGRVDDYQAALVVAMRQHGVTALYVKEHSTLLAHEIAGATDSIAVLAENVILMQHVSYHAELHRVLSVIKMRFSAHDTHLRELTITAPIGIQVLGQEQTGTGVLEGIARKHEDSAPIVGPSTPPGGYPRQQGGLGQGTRGG